MTVSSNKKSYSYLDKIREHYILLCENSTFNTMVLEVREVFGIPDKGFDDDGTSYKKWLNLIRRNDRKDIEEESRSVASQRLRRRIKPIVVLGDLDSEWYEIISQHILFNNIDKFISGSEESEGFHVYTDFDPETGETQIKAIISGYLADSAKDSLWKAISLQQDKLITKELKGKKTKPNFLRDMEIYRLKRDVEAKAISHMTNREIAEYINAHILEYGYLIRKVNKDDVKNIYPVQKKLVEGVLKS